MIITKTRGCPPLLHRRRRSATVALLAFCAALVLGPSTAASSPSAERALPGPGVSPIKHVVVIYQENHTFDNVLGRLCVRIGRCDGTTTGTLPGGASTPLRPAPDIVPHVDHKTSSQVTAIDGGAMDGFAEIRGCTAAEGYGCLTQYRPSQIPNLARLARRFVISDRTFQMSSVPSWGAHLELVTSNLDGFVGDNPRPGTAGSSGDGWGCDSNRDAAWQASPSDPITYQPSCIPDYSLDPTLYPYGGAYRATPVQPVPTLMDELDQAGLRWKLYAGTDVGPSQQGGYSRAICPTFAQCLYTPQRERMVDSGQVLADAQAGKLPNFSIVLPSAGNSQHNENSMAKGDNWIGGVVSQLENGPRWRSTAIFITYDDCGCFYDHVAPPAGLGIRTPMVIVSPWAKARATDSTEASVNSLLAFTEHTFGLPPLSDRDLSAYDYADAFDFRQPHLAPIPMTRTRLPSDERRYLRRHPAPDGDT